eukprot:TRINITY_DN4251_c0_g1_i2.p2 TRINITY_DN4251_c0_g1~~TRINITY_DN4251_c0_g1_i2.p2  ORF type:complete len:397 (-),score=92.52 TRINITY_DN4251_c0_g1_i2:247-1437(-)
MSEYPGVETSLAKLPDDERAHVERILYGGSFESIALPDEVSAACKEHDFVVQMSKVGRPLAEQLRRPRVVRVAVAQNAIVLPTTAPVAEQYVAIERRVGQLIDAAGRCGVNVLCLQEAWTAPFFFCTREKYPWMEFAEDPHTGRSTRFIAAKAKEWNMVIVSPILERDATHCGVIWNTAVVISNRGNVIGTHRKNHIPSVGDFNEANYYRDGNDGWPVFQTDFGRVAVNICYGRHHPLNWQAFALNGADIIFNPSATVGGLSEPLWAIEGRNAAIANSVFTASCNRVGTETFPQTFTSGDGKPAHADFGHFYGSSYVAAPDGTRTPALPRDKDGVKIAEVDLNLIQQVRDSWMFQSTGRHADYSRLFARYIKPDFVPQIVHEKTGTSAPTPDMSEE